MAQKIILVDDINGEDADETVRFGLDGTSYQIDLNTANASRLRDQLAEFIEHARKESSSGRPVRTPRQVISNEPKADKGIHARARQWAQEQGIEISNMGKVPEEILGQYRKSQES